MGDLHVDLVPGNTLVCFFISPELFHFRKCFDPRTRISTNHCAKLESRDARLVLRSAVKHTQNSDLKSYESFHYSLGWTVCRKRETCVQYLFAWTRDDSDRALRSPEFLSVLSDGVTVVFPPGLGSQQGNHGSIYRKVNFVKTTVLSHFLVVGINCLQNQEHNFDFLFREDFGRGEAM